MLLHDLEYRHIYASRVGDPMKKQEPFSTCIVNSVREVINGTCLKSRRNTSWLSRYPILEDCRAPEVVPRIYGSIIK